MTNFCFKCVEMIQEFSVKNFYSFKEENMVSFLYNIS